MKPRLHFYLLIFVLVILDSVLLTSPNLLGKIGLFFYKYHYLRTFPRAFLTVFLIAGLTVLLAEVIRSLILLKFVSLKVGRFFIFLCVMVSIGWLVSVHLDFAKWAYSHTGIRFRYGVFLLPLIVISTFVYTLFTLKERHHDNSQIIEDEAAK